MKRLLSSVLLVLFLPACLPMTPMPTLPPAQPTETSALPTAAPHAWPALRRGINFGNMLEAPNEGEWGLLVEEEYFDLVKEAGFDFVRLPLRWNAHAEAESPYTLDPAFFARVDEIVHWALDRDLSIIIDFHHYEEMASDPWGHKDRFLEIWRQIAEHYKNYPADVLFELLNEPNDQLDASLWNQYLTEALAVVRESNPERDVIIGAVDWNAFNWLSTLDVPDDPHVIATFHYYLPFEFTHQGAEWIGEESNQWLGTTWGSEEEKAGIIRDFDAVAEWSKRHGNIRILLGEFGAYSKGDIESRVRWTTFVREQAERHGFAWAYWEFGSGFGVYDPETETWRSALRNALIPSTAE